MVQIKTFINSSLQTIENEINLWLDKHSYIIKEIKIDQTEHNYFAYIVYDNNTIPATFVDESKAEMWF